VSTLYVKNKVLIVNLYDGEPIEVPGLTQESIDLIFQLHANYIELYDITPVDIIHEKFPQPPSFTEALMQSQADKSSENSFRIGFSSIDEFGSVLQHNPQQASAPELPPEVLQKIAAITQIIAPEDVQNLPKPEPHCNCMHCQIARAVQQTAHSTEAPKELPEEVVKPEELEFQQWDVKQTGDNLFDVTNRLDTLEHYNVYLGQPVGCTCGCQGCEHVLAVLRS
jgi:hypothetical protein